MSEPLWTSGEIVAATGGALAAQAFAATGVSIDTRTIEPGDLFVALAGARDGHEFIDQALAKGAAGALATRAGAGARIIVGDTLTALEHLGVAARDRAARARRGVVTGSVGKTSVTQAIAAGLKLAGPSHTSVHSYNNHIGVPLTLARMPRGTRRAIFEIGMNHPGEIAPLSRMVRPEAAAITTVGPVHVENFADGEVGVARAKAEIFAGMTAGGTAILNADNPWFDLLTGEAERAGCKVWAFGSGRGLRRPPGRHRPPGRRAAHPRRPAWPQGRLRGPPDRRPLGPEQPGRAADAGSAGCRPRHRPCGAVGVRAAGGAGRWRRAHRRARRRLHPDRRLRLQRQSRCRGHPRR